MRFILDKPGAADTVITDSGATIYVYRGDRAGVHLPEDFVYGHAEPVPQEFWSAAELRELASALNWAADRLERSPEI